MDWLWMLIVAARGVSPAPDDVWATRLATLDAIRAEAFASGDVSLLDDVYARGSDGSRADRRTIAAYAERGGRVVGAELRVLSAQVVAASSRRARLDVVDQLAPAQVRWADGTTTQLPRDRATRRLVTLVRSTDGSGAWKIAASSSVSARR